MQPVPFVPEMLVLGSVWNTLLVHTLETMFFLSTILLMVIILLQEGKGGGLASALGGQGAETFGVSSGGVNKVTLVLAGIFLVSALGHALAFNQTATSGIPVKAGSSAPVLPSGSDDGAPPKEEGAGTEPPKKEGARTESPPVKAATPPAKTDAPPAKTDAPPAKTDTPPK